MELQHALAAEHPARLIARGVQALDLQPLLDSFGPGGSAAYRPDLMLRVALYAVSQGEHSPAAWCRLAHENIPVRWLAQDIRPSRARWYAFRRRLQPLLDGWLRQVLGQAQQQGLTTGAQAAGDGTTVAALASRHKLVNQATLQRRQEQLQQVLTADAAAAAAAPVGTTATAAAAAPAAAAADTAPAREVSAPAGQLLRAPVPADVVPAAPGRPAWMATTPAGRQQQAHRLAQAGKRLQKLLQRNAQRRPKERRPESRVVVSPSEPEAALGLDKQRVFRPLYNVQWLADVESPLILAYGVFAQPNDAGTLPALLQHCRSVLGHLPKDLLMDGSYANGPDAAAAEAAGVRLYAPWGSPKAQSKPGRQIPKEQFQWEPAARRYVGPQGHPLERSGCRWEKDGEGVRHVQEVYRCASRHCRDCPLQVRCTSGPGRGRTVQRGEHEDVVERLRARMQSPAAKQLYAKRKQTVELRFADWKEHRKMRRWTSRGRQGAETQVGLTVLTHNLGVVQKGVDRRRDSGTQNGKAGEGGT